MASSESAIARSRVPTTRAQVAKSLGQDESYFWPQLLGTEQSRNATQSELVLLWPTRQLVPGDVWRSLFRQASEQIDVLVYSEGFLIEAYDLVEVIRTKPPRGYGSASCSAILTPKRCTSERARSDHPAWSTQRSDNGRSSPRYSASKVLAE